jgi:hypothetical protein
MAGLELPCEYNEESLWTTTQGGGARTCKLDDVAIVYIEARNHSREVAVHARREQLDATGACRGQGQQTEV